MNVLLSTTYFGPIQWYQKLYRADEVWIECHETFQKQTYRNRCVIATTQGTQALTIPIEAPSNLPQLGEANSAATKAQPTSPSGGRQVGAIRISDHGNWRHLHWNALRSAYGDSPFFMYYEDDIRPFFEQRWDYLFDFNEAIREKICELLDIQPNIRYTDRYVADITNDFRNTITPKHPAPDPDFTPRRYYQVYEAKHGFQPNLSILDLLFNMGPESIFWL